jgi:hypothetical protein
VSDLQHEGARSVPLHRFVPVNSWGWAMNVESEPSHAPGMYTPTARHDGAGVDLYWIPLGAGGAGFVRLNGLVYEAIKARLEDRRPLDLYHAALEVHVPQSRYVIEMTPIPDHDPESRGVVVEGPVGNRWLSGLRVFRYEVRRWRSGDSEHAHRLLDLVDSVPPLVWGRDQLAVGDMWSSNSVISWLLTRGGLPVEGIRPPMGGRAPGWRAGITMADHNPRTEDHAGGRLGRRSAESSPITSHLRVVDGPVDENPTVMHWLP